MRAFLKTIRAEWKQARDARKPKQLTETTEMVVKTPPWEYLIDPKADGHQPDAAIVDVDDNSAEINRQLDAVRQDCIGAVLKSIAVPLRAISAILSYDDFHVLSKPFFV